MTGALANERAVRLGVEYPDVTRFLTAYWPTQGADNDSLVFGPFDNK